MAVGSEEAQADQQGSQEEACDIHSGRPRALQDTVPAIVSSSFLSGTPWFLNVSAKDSLFQSLQKLKDPQLSTVAKKENHSLYEIFHFPSHPRKYLSFTSLYSHPIGFDSCPDSILESMVSFPSPTKELSRHQWRYSPGGRYFREALFLLTRKLEIWGGAEHQEWPRVKIPGGCSGFLTTFCGLHNLASVS